MEIFFWSKQFSWWPWIQRKFLLVALKPLLAFSLMFSKQARFGLLSIIPDKRTLVDWKKKKGHDEHDQVG